MAKIFPIMNDMPDQSNSSNICCISFIYSIITIVFLIFSIALISFGIIYLDPICNTDPIKIQYFIITYGILILLLTIVGIISGIILITKFNNIATGMHIATIIILAICILTGTFIGIELSGENYKNTCENGESLWRIMVFINIINATIIISVGIVMCCMRYILSKN